MFQEGTDAERAVLLEQQGYDLACFVDGIIHELGVLLPGGIMLVGWSLGTIFLLSLIACIENLPGEMKDRLSEFVHTVVLLRSYLPFLYLTMFTTQPYSRAPFTRTWRPSSARSTYSSHRS